MARTRGTAVFIAARCCKGSGKPFVMRIVKQENGCSVENATELHEHEVAGGDPVDIQAPFYFSPSYPGCPHCGGPEFFQCSCGQIGCWDRQAKRVTCAWCRKTVELTTTIEQISGRSG